MHLAVLATASRRLAYLDERTSMFCVSVYHVSSNMMTVPPPANAARADSQPPSRRVRNMQIGETTSPDLTPAIPECIITSSRRAHVLPQTQLEPHPDLGLPAHDVLAPCLRGSGPRSYLLGALGPWYFAVEVGSFLWCCVLVLELDVSEPLKGA